MLPARRNGDTRSKYSEEKSFMRKKMGIQGTVALGIATMASAASTPTTKRTTCPVRSIAFRTCKTPPTWCSNWPIPTMTTRSLRKRQSIRATCSSVGSFFGLTPMATECSVPTRPSRLARHCSPSSPCCGFVLERGRPTNAPQVIQPSLPKRRNTGRPGPRRQESPRR